MAKRFTSTEIWVEDWFLDMPNEYKLFWYYMLSNCDHAGIFRVNTKTFSNLLEVKISSLKFLEFVNGNKIRIRVVSTTSWFIEDFFFYQYGHIFNVNNKVHNSILKIYNKFNINILEVRGLKEVKLSSIRPQVEDTVGVKDKDIDKDKDIKYNRQENTHNGTLVQKMFSVWELKNPNYQTNETLDLPATLSLAKKICKSKKWKFEDALKNKLPDCLESWEKICDFVIEHSFFKKLDLKGLDGQWASIYQTMSADIKEKLKPKNTIDEKRKNPNFYI